MENIFVMFFSSKIKAGWNCKVDLFINIYDRRVKEGGVAPGCPRILVSNRSVVLSITTRTLYIFFNQHHMLVGTDFGLITMSCMAAINKSPNQDDKSFQGHPVGHGSLG
jgi:hypothetical protein